MGDNSPLERTRWQSFLGEFRVKLDAKGRLTLPSVHRRELGGEGDVLVLRAGSEAFIQVIPFDEWKRVQAELKRAGAEGRRGRDLQWERRLRSSEVTPTTLDLKGRITVPKALLEKSGIQKEVLVVGNENLMELWNPKAFFEGAQGKEHDRGAMDDILYGG